MRYRPLLTSSPAPCLWPGGRRGLCAGVGDVAVAGICSTDSHTQPKYRFVSLVIEFNHISSSLIRRWMNESMNESLKESRKRIPEESSFDEFVEGWLDEGKEEVGVG